MDTLYIYIYKNVIRSKKCEKKSYQSKGDLIVGLSQSYSVHVVFGPLVLHAVPSLLVLCVVSGLLVLHVDYSRPRV